MRKKMILEISKIQWIRTGPLLLGHKNLLEWRRRWIDNINEFISKLYLINREIVITEEKINKQKNCVDLQLNVHESEIVAQIY